MAGREQMVLVAPAAMEGRGGELNAMQVARGAVERQGLREEKLHDTAQGALDRGARSQRAEADVAAAIGCAPGAALALTGAAGGGFMSTTEGRA
ncbi:MAG TPA: hypothetical protein VG714_08485 [Acidobacteriaceae bacterium]|nr:hypothetical protein [Acidobacteriaceae bacterium]